MEKISRELGVRAETLERWRAEALSEPAQERTWTAEARLETVIATAAMDESARSTLCYENGVYPSELAKWLTEAVEALAGPAESRATPGQTRRDRCRIKELERELRRKDKALAESAALPVLEGNGSNFHPVLPRRESVKSVHKEGQGLYGLWANRN